MKKVGVWGLFYVGLIGVAAYGCISAQRFYVAPSHGYVLSEHSQITALSADCKKRLQVFFKKQGALRQSPNAFVGALQKAFPVLEKITLSYKNQKKTSVIVQCAHPLFVFNKQLAFIDTGIALPQADFSPELIAHLPHFTVACNEDTQSFSPECVRYARTLNPAIHDSYDVEWVDSSLIKFHSKQHQKIMLLGSVETKADDITHPACQKLIAELIERKPGRKGTKNDWCIDRRFKGQMIVFPGGRVTNEKSVCG